jgi:alkylation response protein AidB-like acyl-CoA dehydrogenase
LTYVPNAILALGSESQKEIFLPQLSRGELSWFVGYSEPEAGSDLASLKTVAVSNGDDFILTGQKAFSSDAHFADYGLVIARTDPDPKKHRGLSMVIVDMSSPGVRVTTQETLAGWTHHSVYFDNVLVPKPMLVGARGEGWKVVMGAIDHERAALAAPGMNAMQLDRLIGFAGATTDGARPIDDPVIRDRLAALAIEAEGARLMAYEVASMQARGLTPQHETSLAVLAKRETARAFDVLGMEMLGQAAPLRSAASDAFLDGDVELEYRDHLYFQFAAGGFDITRNIIAVRGLGLPR